MTRRLLFSALLTATLTLTACGGSAETTRMWIGPELIECEGVAPMMCMQVAYSQDEPYELFYEQIKGFDFQSGTSYVIDVEITEVENPPADASSLEYTLVEVIAEN